jgi:signal peptidase
MYKIDKIQKENQRIHLIGKIISLIIYIIIIPIIIFNFTLIIKSFINPNETPNFFGYKSFVIISKSMETTIMKGDAILAKEVPEDEIQLNDIISFSKDGIIVTHRVVAITEENGIKVYTTKGDNNINQDKEKITYQQIEGKYQFKIKKFGVIVEILKNKITLIILILILVLIQCYKLKIKRKKQERKEKRKQYIQEKDEQI